MKLTTSDFLVAPGILQLLMAMMIGAPVLVSMAVFFPDPNLPSDIGPGLFYVSHRVKMTRSSFDSRNHEFYEVVHSELTQRYYWWKIVICKRLLKDDKHTIPLLGSVADLNYYPTQLTKFDIVREETFRQFPFCLSNSVDLQNGFFEPYHRNDWKGLKFEEIWRG